LLSSYTFSVSTLEPFFAMHRCPQPARTSVRYSPATQTSPGLVLHAVRYRSIVGLCCAVIVVTIPFLKIVVSGLITTANEPAQRLAMLAQTTTFNTTSVALSSSSDLAKQVLALSQIEKYNLPLPAWTVTTGAVAQLDTVRLGQLIQSPNTTITVPLEVMRADLGGCSAVTATPNATLGGATVQLVPPCANVSLADSSVDIPLPTSPGWFGKIHPFTGCAGAYALIYGNTQFTNATVIQSITVVQCLSYTLST
jgi:hypothetical protein